MNCQNLEVKVAGVALVSEGDRMDQTLLSRKLVAVGWLVGCEKVCVLLSNKVNLLGLYCFYEEIPRKKRDKISTKMIQLPEFNGNGHL